MLKIYTSLDAVPEALRSEYKLSDGRYVPDLSDDHPVLAHNKVLLTEKSTATARVRELEADIEQAKSTSVPRGHVAVAKADAELLDKYKALGKPDEVIVKLTEHEGLKAESTKRAREDSHRKVAAKLGYNEAAFLQLSNLPDMEIRGEGDKQTVVALVRDGDKVTERPATEYVEANYAPLLPALKTSEGVTVHGSAGGSETKPDAFAWAREFGKNWNESKPATDVKAAFGITT